MATKLKLEPELITYIDKKLEKNTFAQLAIKNKQPRLVLCEVQKSLVGVKELTGKNDGKMIRLIQETFGGAYGEPYCIAGVMTGVAYAALKTGVPHKLYETESSKELWEKTPAAQNVKLIPLPGAIAIWGDVNSKGQWTGTGHGETVLFADDKTFHCVGFNTSGTVNPNDTVNRDGNGVYYTVRTYKDTAKRKLRGFKKPF